MKKIVTFVHTEYHLLLFINRLLNEQEAGIVHNHFLFLRNQSRARIKSNYDFSQFDIHVNYLDADISIYRGLSSDELSLIENIKSLRPDEFVFYQEMDALMVLLVQYCKQAFNTKVVLYQDGLKPYNILRYNPLSLLKHHHQTNVWLKKQGYSIDSWLSPLWSHRYAFMKGIDEVWLTFPESYINWNNKTVCKIEIRDFVRLKVALEKVFGWEASLLPQKKEVILYMHQTLHDEGHVERNFIKQLKQRFPLYPFYLKPHPLASFKELELYKKEGIHIIESNLPAELFILNLQQSMIVSINSTSMFLNNPANQYYYLYRFFEKDIKRLKKYNIKKHPSPHLHLVKSIEDLKF